MKWILVLVLVSSLFVSLLTGCSKDQSSDNGNTASSEEVDTSGGEKATEDDTEAAQVEEVTIKLMQNKPELSDVLKELEPLFEAENPGLKIKFDTIGGSADYNSGLMAKFQSGDAPDIFANTGFTELNKWFDKVEDLSDQPWIEDVVSSGLDPVTVDGKAYGFPLAIEGFGYAYNKTLFEEAGITTLPNTLESLEEACEKLEAAGIMPFSNTYAEWWALGVHTINAILAQQGDVQQYLDDIAAGTIHFKDTANVDQWVELIDLTVKYGQKNAITTGDYTNSVAVFSSGQAAMIQQGTWMQIEIDKVNADLDVGMMPMPFGDEPNNMVFAGVPNFWVVNTESEVKEEAKIFLNWLATSDTGRNFLTEKMNVVPAFKSIDANSSRGLNLALYEYAKEGNTLAMKGQDFLLVQIKKSDKQS